MMKPKEMNGPGSVARLLWTLALCLVFAPVAFSDPATATLGELLVARGVSVDNSLASPGLTLLQGSRVKTDAEGGAILNLGRLGRVTLGPEAELVLESSDRALSGQLLSGWMIVSAPKGVEVAIKTADGVATADGVEAATLRVDLTQETTRIETAGSASLHTGALTQTVKAGEELELSRPVGGALPIFSRHALEASLASSDAASRAAAASFGGALSTSVRAAIESVTLDQTLAPAPSHSSGLKPVAGDSRVVSVASQEITCGFFNENCIDCSIFPQLVKAKAGCTLSFIVRFQNVFAHSRVTVRPFISSACFRIFPGYPQIVLIPPGGSALYQINANNCTVAQTQSAAAALLVIETNTCGTKYVQVEWATPCR